MTIPNPLFAPSRQLSLEGQITYLTGTQVDFFGDNALSCTVTEGSADGRLLGGAFSAVCALTLHNQNGLLPESRSLRGAQVKVRLRSGEQILPLCVFTVDQVSHAENDCRLILRGSDALGTAFEGVLEDDFSYPRSLGDLAQAVAAQAGFTLQTDFPNAAFVLPARPAWGDVTLRQTLSFIACAAGCFARITRGGALEFCPVWRQDAVPYALPAEMTLRREYGEASFGPLTGLSLVCHQAPQDAPPLTAALGSALLAETNSLSISGNPLFPYGGSHTQALLNAALNAVAGLKTQRATVTWRGDPALTVGSRVAITDAQGNVTQTLVTGQTLSFFRGFSMETRCAHPAPQAAVGRIFTPSGALNAAMLQGSADGAIIRDGTLAARALVAGSVTAQQLAAGAVTADKIAAGVIGAEALSAVKAEIRHLAAGEITADQLYADLASIVQAQFTTANIDRANIDWASVHLLSAAAADIAKTEIGEAKIGHGQIYDLAADTALIEKGASGKFYFRRLSVDSAQMVDLTVGQLTVKAADGQYYSLNVNLNSGAVTADPVTVTPAEIAAGQTESGQHIIETDLTVSDLNAATATAVEALISKLTAGRIDADVLFAREAVLHQIEAMDITGNRSLRLMMNTKNKVYSQWDEPAGTAENPLQTGDIWHRDHGMRTWAEAEEAAWEEAENYPYNSFLGPQLYVYREGRWVLTDDLGAVKEQSAKIQLTEDQVALQAQRVTGLREELAAVTVRSGSIDLRVTAAESAVSGLDQQVNLTGVPKVKTSRVTIDDSGIALATGGAFTVASGNFSIDAQGNVTMQGSVTAAQGTVGGWTLSSSKLSSGSGGNYVHMDSAGAYAFLAGSETEGSAPFRVKRDGTVYLTKLIAVDDQNNETVVNLTNYPFWKLSGYNTVRGISSSVSGSTVTISLATSGGTLSTNFTKPGVGAVRLSGGGATSFSAEAYNLGDIPGSSSPAASCYGYLFLSGSPYTRATTATVGTTSGGGGVAQLSLADYWDAACDSIALSSIERQSGNTFSDNLKTVYFNVRGVLSDGREGPWTQVSADVTDAYRAGYAAGWAAAKGMISLSGNVISGPSNTVDASETLYTVTVSGSISTLSNVAPNTFFAQGSASALVNGSAVAGQTFSKSQQFNVGQ